MGILFMAAAGTGNPTLEAMRWQQDFGGNLLHGVNNAVPRVAGGWYYSSTVATSLKQIPAASELFMGFGLYPNPDFQLRLYGDSATTMHLTLVRSGGFLALRRGSAGGTLLATGTTVIPTNTWTHIQVRATISDTVGVVQVRLNGAATNEINFTGDTKNGGTNSTIDAFDIYNSAGNFTDLLVLDTTGAANNTWPGDRTIQMLAPNGNGATSDGTGSDGDQVNNFLLVDENPWATTDYVGVATAGSGDTYSLADLAAGTSTVYAAQVITAMGKSDAGTKSGRNRIRSGGSTYTGTTRVLSTSYAAYWDVYETNPNGGGAWTPSAVNALEAGFEAQ